MNKQRSEWERFIITVKSEDERVALEERAAILEYEAGYSRDEAERRTIARWRERNEQAS